MQSCAVVELLASFQLGVGCIAPLDSGGMAENSCSLAFSAFLA